MKRELAVVLVSGGMDSCVCAAMALQQHQAAFLHVSYGQRTARQELRAFHRIAEYYGTERTLVCELPHLGRIGGSSLTDTALAVEEPDLERREIPSSYVPFRNAHFLSIATSWGEVLGARSIYIGAVFEDSSGYPDCRPQYYRAFNRLIEAGTRPETRLQVLTPVIRMKKREIVAAGLGLGAPLHLTWSCYREGDVACGRCDSCALRRRGFREAGVEDPTPYLNADKT